MSMFKILLDGVPLEAAATLDVINPVDETIAANVPDADIATIDRAVAATAAAYGSWRSRVNQHCALDPALPFPAHKQSGLGAESGREGLYAYTAPQIVNIAKAA
jgi:acyl-CoA reductase-like NAD-dependent aldehyde dehydrogenase